MNDNLNINFEGGLGENQIPGITDREAMFPGSEGPITELASWDGGIGAIEESVVVVGDGEGAIADLTGRDGGEILSATRSKSSVGEIDSLTGEAIETSAIQTRSRSSDVIEVESIFDSGYFVADETGELKIDYLYDGTRPEGELAIFSLKNFDELNLKSETDFIKEAASRVLSNSELGYVLVNDKNEGAFFDGWANEGEHEGVKSFNLTPGDEYGFMLVPNGSIEQAYEKPYLGGNKKPLFSLKSEEYEEYFPGKQFADVTGNGEILGIEASSVKNPRSDRDYEDLVINIEGLTGTVSPFEEVIKPGKDWREKRLGKWLDEYVDFPKISFDSGYFVVGETGELKIDYLYDGTRPEGELAIFSLKNFDELNLKSETDFIKEAASRVLSNSELGYVLVNDKNEGAFFDGWANEGEHEGVKSFNLTPGDEYALMLVPNGTVKEVFNNPHIGGNKKPLFSLKSEGYEEYFPGKQFADVMGNGEILGIEASALSSGFSDRDYEDLVINIEGLTGTVSPFDEVIKPGKDWRSKSFGKKVKEYIEFPKLTFDYGELVVGESGEVTIDYLFDGGWYQGELGAFSLEGLEVKSYEGFVKEAANRVLSNSKLGGYVAISDAVEGAKFEGRLGERNFNSGDYLGEKTFEMNPGDKFAFMFVPNGSIEGVFNNPKIGGSKHPFFSLVTDNPDDEFRPGQMGDVTGEGTIFAFEDLKVSNENIDRDYNDFVFSVNGVENAEGVAIDLDELINPEKDWRELELGQGLIDSVKGNSPQDLLLLADLLYNPGETLDILGKVSDADGGGDIARIDFWLQRDGGEWEDVAVVTELAVDDGEADEARFAWELAGLEAGKYRLKAIAYDNSGNSGEEVTEDFTVLSLTPEEEELSSRVKWAIERAMNLDSYAEEALAATDQWVVSVKAGESAAELASSFGVENLGSTGQIPNTYIWEFPENADGLEVARRLKAQPEIEFVYPSMSYRANFSSFPWHLRGDGSSGNPADAHITAAWELQGVSGEGVNIGIIDDGFDYLHPELASESRYREDWSWDFDENDGTPGHFLETTATYPESAIVSAGGNITLKLQRDNGDPRIDQKLFSGLLTNLTLDLDFMESASNVKVTLRSPQGTEFEVNDAVSGEYSTNLFNGESPNKAGINGVWQLKVENNSTESVALKNWSLDLTTTNYHGTQVAGVAVGSQKESVPAGGVAPEAGWAALRLGADGFAEKEIADALSHQRDDIDIYNNSWGVGFLAEPPPLGEAALEAGVKSGRSGLGNSFVFAAGNEGLMGDNVNYNSFANSRHTIAVAAIDHTGKHALSKDENGKDVFYSAPGASLLVSAYSGGRDLGITTTDIQGKYGTDLEDYTRGFGGTSASAPFVSGVVALMLEANPSLSWRDVQHILVETALNNDPTDGEWTTNAGGYDINHKYGFGAVNGLEAVKLAKDWQSVDKEVSLSEAMLVSKIIPDNDTAGLKSSVELEEEIEVEWVEVMFDGSHADRDNLKIELVHTNPDGTETRSLLAEPFTGEPTGGNSYNWTFTSARHWGESSLGTWELRVSDETQSTKDPDGIWSSWQLNLFGTKPNAAPEATNLDQELNYTEEVAIALQDIVVADPDTGDRITVSLELNNPAGGTIATGEDESDAAGALSFEGPVEDVNSWLAGLEFTPALDFTDNLEVTVAVTDNHISRPLTGTINLLGEADNDAPTVAQQILNQRATEDEPFEFVLPAGTFADVDDESLNYSAIVVGGEWLSFDGATGTFSGTPTNDDVGIVEVTVTAADAAGAEVSDEFAVTVENVNDAPTVVKEIADQTATVGEMLRFALPEDTFADADAGDSLSYNVTLEDGSPLPDWLGFDSATRTFLAMPGREDVGSLSVKVEARDKEDARVSDVFVLAVEAATLPIDLRGQSFMVMPGVLAAGDNFNVGFMLQNVEAGDAGEFEVGFYLSVDEAINESDRFLGSYTVGALAGNGGTGSFLTQQLPEAGDEFWKGDGSYFVGMISDVGGAIAESNEDNNASLGAGIDYATIEVNSTEPLPTNTPPTLTAVSTLTGATEGEAYTISYEELLAASDAADADGDTLTFQIEESLSGELTKDGETVAIGATVLAEGEEIVWTPDVAGDAVGALTVKVFDGEEYSDVAVEVVVAVAAGNTAPTLTDISTLTGATEGEAYTISYEELLAASDAADADGDTLTFQIEESLSGELTKDGETVAIGATVLAEGEEIVWTPDVAGDAVGALTVKAFDGEDYSDVAVEVVVAVAIADDSHTFNWVRTYFGEDINSTQNLETPALDDPTRLTSMPNADNARNAFFANITNVETEDFEAYTDLEIPSSLSFGSVSATITGNEKVRQYSTGTHYGAYPISGNKFLNLFGDERFTIEFNSPQSVFGFYANDIGDYKGQMVLTLHREDGSTNNLTVPNTVSNNQISGSVLYFGIIDTESPFTGITFNNTKVTDGLGLDDLIIGEMDLEAIATSTTPANQTSAQSYTEDTSLNLVDLVVTDPDGETTVTMTLSNPAAGGLTTGTSGDATATFDPDSGVWSAVGAVADVNALLAAVEFEPAKNFNDDLTVAISITDDTAEPLAGTINLTGVATNDSPELTAISTLTGATESQPYTITYNNLLAASNATDADGDALTFQIEELLSGELTKDGETVAPGATVLAEGEEIVWTPDVAGDAVGALTVKAFDGEDYSDVAVEVVVAVEEAIPIQPLVKLGDEFQVNTYTNSEQNYPAVTALSDGGFVVTWHSNGQDGSEKGIFGQRHDSRGNPVGEEFQVNTYTNNFQAYPSVAALPKGGFVVTWHSNGQDGSDYGIFGQRYNSRGNRAGNEFRVNTKTIGYQAFPSVNALADSGFVVTWTSRDNSTHSFFGQRYDSNGNPVGDEFQVDPDANGYGWWGPKVATLSDGEFVVTWSSKNADGSNYDVYGQRYNSSGDPIGEKFQVNTYTSDRQNWSSVTALANSGFIVTWQSDGQDGSSDGVFGQRYDNSGKRVGEEFQVNTYTNSWQMEPSATALSDGGFIVTWQSNGQDGSSYGVFGQRYDSNGKQVGEEFQINTYIDSSQRTPSVAALPEGFVVTWASLGQDGSDYGIYAQRFGVNTAPTLTEVSTLTGATQGETYTITYNNLLAASNATDADGDALTFQIEGLLSGELTKDGETVAIGATVLAEGEEIVWTPDVVGDAVGALSVKAFDGKESSDTAVEVTVAVSAKDLNNLAGVRYGVTQWADYDSDGDLDILIAGDDTNGLGVSKIYRNDSGNFTDIAADIVGVGDGSAGAWGDYDNDGDLDLILAGETGTANVTKLYNNDGGNFIEVEIELPQLDDAAAAWGDYDNDGDLDLALSGTDGTINVSKIYQNQNGNFVDIAAEIEDVAFGPDLEWGDYDRDGDLDLLLTGGINALFGVAKIYRNDGGNFTDIEAGLPGVNVSSAAWGDYDSDGDLDIAINGASPFLGSSAIYRNDGGNFVNINAGLTGLLGGSVNWGDYDNDGDLDLLITGSEIFTGTSKIYTNNNGSFVELETDLPNLVNGKAAFGDYDRDGDLDILLTGHDRINAYTKLYNNNLAPTANTAPTAPTGLSGLVDGSDVTFSWNAATDAETPTPGLTYNLRVGTTPKGSEVVSPGSLVGGDLLVPAKGNVDGNTSWSLKNLEPGTYYWSVQAVDAGFAGSEFATEGSFTVKEGAKGSTEAFVL